MKARQLDTVLFVRMTKAETEKLKAVAQREGFRSLSEYIRVALKKVVASA